MRREGMCKLGLKLTINKDLTRKQQNYQYNKPKSSRSMSVEQYFNFRKNWIAAFFTNLNNLINQISITVQLQVDNQYITAKHFIMTAGLNQDHVLQYCQDMTTKHNHIKTKVLKILYDHVIGSVDLQSQGIGKSANGQKQNEHQNNQREPVGIFGQNTNEADILKPQINSPQTNTQSTIVKQKNHKGLSTISRHSKELFNIQENLNNDQGNGNMDREKKMLTQSSKDPQPISLMNKKRNASSNKNTVRQVYKSLQKDREGKESINQGVNPQMFPLTHSASESKFRNQKAQTSYANFRSNQQNRTQAQGHRPSSLYNSRSNQQHMMTGQLDDNQFLCEKLDKKIQQEAMALLNKVKTKRSPNRKKIMSSLSKKNGDKSCNAFSVLDISSQNPSVLTRQGYLQRLREDR